MYIVSVEEDNIIETLCEIAKDNHLAVHAWDTAFGCIDYTLEDEKLKIDYKDIDVGQKKNTGSSSSGQGQPARATQFTQHMLSIAQSNESAIYVFKDIHTLFATPASTRAFKDINEKILYDRSIGRKDGTGEDLKQYVVGIAPVYQNVPVELDKTFALIEYELPSYDKIRHEILEHINEDMNCNVLSDKEKDEIAIALSGLTEDEIYMSLVKSLVQTDKIDLDFIIAEKQDIIRKNGVLEFYPANEGLNDIGGLDSLKQWIEVRGKAFHSIMNNRIPRPKGVLLVGIPGTGKSLTCKSIARSWNVPLIRLDIGKLMSARVGSSEANMRRATETIDGIGKCIVWIDEIEKGLAGIDSSGQSDGGTFARVFGSFLTWLNDNNSHSFIVATANNIESMPIELLRKGRFDDIFFIDLPTDQEKKDILKIHLKKHDYKEKDFKMDDIISHTAGFSGAEIEQMLIEGIYKTFAASDDLTMLNSATLIEAADETIPLSKSNDKEIAKLREWGAVRAKSASTKDGNGNGHQGLFGQSNTKAIAD